MDILFALRYGKPIVFFRDRFSEVRSTIASINRNSHSVSTTPTRQNNEINPYLQNILDDTMIVSSFFNSASNSQTLDITMFLELLVSICCRLIRFLPLQNQKPKCKVKAAYHIGLLTFMTTLFLQWDIRRIDEYNKVSERLREVINDDLDNLDSDFVLWFLFIASMWFSVTCEHGLVLRIRTLTTRLDITSWSRVRDSLSKFPWICALHDQPGRLIWNVVEQKPRESDGR